jgi:hypothetical protein
VGLDAREMRVGLAASVDPWIRILASIESSHRCGGLTGSADQNGGGPSPTTCARDRRGPRVHARTSNSSVAQIELTPRIVTQGLHEVGVLQGTPRRTSGPFARKRAHLAKSRGAPPARCRR